MKGFPRPVFPLDALPWSPGPISLHKPPHADAAHIGVEVEEGPDAQGLRHDVAERWPLCRLQAEQTQDELAQLRTVPVRDGCKSATHDLQHQSWQVL